MGRENSRMRREGGVPLPVFVCRQTSAKAL
jgi:hypothetical protein